MRSLIVLALLCLPFALATAQEAPVGSLDVAKLIEDFDNSIRAHSQKLIAAKSDAERATLSTQFPSPDKLAPTMQRIMTDHPDAASQVRACCWLVSRASQLPAGQAAVEALKTRFAASKGLVEVIDFLGHSAPTMAEGILRAIREKNANLEEKAAATHSLANLLFGIHESDPNGPRAKPALDEATALYTEMITTYKDVVANGFKLSDQAAATLFEIQNIQPGLPVPEVEGKDGSGTAFKISDYRGKVVVLIFWGSWCHACHATLDGVKQAVAAAGDKAVLLGVNTDPLETYKQLASTQGITWRNWCDEFNRGPISAMFNIRHWPTIFVIDAQGIIRGKDVPSGQLPVLLKDLAK